MLDKAYIFVTLCGGSPAVITESLFCLKKNENIVPKHVYAITTKFGKEQIEEKLLNTGNNVINLLWKKLDVTKKPSFNLNVISDAGGIELGDIVTKNDNDTLSDYLLKALQAIKNNHKTATIIFSIAGGRKTMSVIATLIFSMIATGDDRLCHVLVNHPFDSRLDPPFYFPDDVNRKLGEEYVSVEPNLTLADIPVIKTRSLFGISLNDEGVKYSDLVGKGETSLSDIVLPSITMTLGKDRQSSHIEVQFNNQPNQTKILELSDYKNNLELYNSFKLFFYLMKYCKDRKQEPSYLEFWKYCLNDKIEPYWKKFKYRKDPSVLQSEWVKFTKKEFQNYLKRDDLSKRYKLETQSLTDEKIYQLVISNQNEFISNNDYFRKLLSSFRKFLASLKDEYKNDKKLFQNLEKNLNIATDGDLYLGSYLANPDFYTLVDNSK